MIEEREGLLRRRNQRRKRWNWPGVLLFAVLIAVCIATVCWAVQKAFPWGTLHEGIPAENLDTASHTPLSDMGIEEPQDKNTPWYLTLVNRWRPLPEDYNVSLVEAPGGERVDERIYDPLMEMLDAAAEDNLGPIVVSGYRTEEKQQRLYEEKIQKYRQEGYSREEAVELAEQWVARPDTSEHQLGLAVDINGAVYDIYLWLQEHSWKYGFIFRYPGYKSSLTGVAEEVWHYRYVGKEAAQEIHEQGVCLEEYLETSRENSTPWGESD